MIYHSRDPLTNQKVHIAAETPAIYTPLCILIEKRLQYRFSGCSPFALQCQYTPFRRVCQVLFAHFVRLVHFPFRSEKNPYRFDKNVLR